MMAGPDSDTVTPGSTPPASSTTLPTISPKIWPVCARAGAKPRVRTNPTAIMVRSSHALM